MKIIIPMAGRGKRFTGFLSPKPILQVDGKHMIEHVVNCFPRKSNFVFICNNDHLKNTGLPGILEKASPGSVTIGVDDDLLRGPAVSLLPAFDLIGDDEEVIVNYCDFIQVWDYKRFMGEIRAKKPAGAITTFRGFHPASLGETYYAYVKADADGFITDLREKKSFSPDKMQDYASTGTYYFSSGALLKRYVKELVATPSMAINGEFYMSLPFALMARDGLRVMNYEVEKFICLGTPRDYELYKFWSELFLDYSPNLITFDNVNLNVTNIFPLASGERAFKDIGFHTPNFLIPLMNKTLLDYSFQSNPRGIHNIFIGLSSEREFFDNVKLFRSHSSETVFLDDVKNGNAATIFTLRDKLGPESPICVCGSTYLLQYSQRRLAQLLDDPSIDVVLFSFSHQECVLRNPKMFAYAKLTNNIEVGRIVEKDTVSGNPYLDRALTGTAFFRKSKHLFDAIAAELGKKPDDPLYYLSCINNLLPELKVVVFDVDRFVPVRTVVDYREFVYWQDYFDGLIYHPYSKMFQ